MTVNRKSPVYIEIVLIEEIYSVGITDQRHAPEVDGRIIMGRVDCTEEVDLCKTLVAREIARKSFFRK
ncbi:hypothetical protein L2E82_07180 [Cichorium intybus]|uniref:Uncharacterized protein n=1 Tax=Cichorium intybus TaxID=13427 RepID=A0ACB9G4Z4_CICIN|nr:hypothetical protein L2E82_07180 [Cichorium intybus]